MRFWNCQRKEAHRSASQMEKTKAGAPPCGMHTHPPASLCSPTEAPASFQAHSFQLGMTDDHWPRVNLEHPYCPPWRLRM